MAYNTNPLHSYSITSLPKSNSSSLSLNSQHVSNQRKQFEIEQLKRQNEIEEFEFKLEK